MTKFSAAVADDPNAPLALTPELIAGMRPSNVPAEAWGVIAAGLTSQMGNTVGDYQALLSKTATQLSLLGEYTPDISRLLSFLLTQADSALVLPRLGGAVDAAAPARGMPLTFAREFQQTVTGRNQLGSLGRGWSQPWDVSLQFDGDGNAMVRSGAGQLFFYRYETDNVFVPFNGFLNPLDGGIALSNDSHAIIDYPVSGGPPGSHPGSSLPIFEGWSPITEYTLRALDGTVTKFAPDGKLRSITDILGNRVTAVYTGDLLTELDHSDGDHFRLDYNSQGRIAQLTDQAGRVTTYTYDAAGQHLLSVAGPHGTTSYTYAVGQGAAREHALLSITSPSGVTQHFDYNDQGVLIGTRNDGEAVTFSYDEPGQVTAHDAYGSSTLQYNSGGQLAFVRDASGHETHFAYDAKGNLIQTTLPGNLTSSYTVDHRGNTTGQVDPLGQRIQTTWNNSGLFPTVDGRLPVVADDRLTRLVDSRGNATGYAYDSQGNPTSITSADGSVETFAYTDGLLTKETNRRGDTTRLTRDARGLVTRKDYADGTHDDFTYDNRGNMLTAANAGGTTAMEYDQADRLTKITYPSGRFLAFTYCECGRRTRMVDQTGFATNYGYDAAGRLSALTDDSGKVLVSYGYDLAGRLARKDMGNGTATTYAYDAAGQLLHLVNLAPNGSVNSRFDYNYDDLGRRTSMTTLEGTTTYGYDATGQLTKVALPGGRTIVYQYDAAGNRVAVSDNGVTTAYLANNLNEYTAVGTTLSTYDKDGNLVTKVDGNKTTSYTYNEQNRLSRVSGPDGTWTYEYDPLGNRVAATHDGQRTEYVIDPMGLGNVVGEYSGNGELDARFVHGLGLASRIDPSGNAAFYDFDALGSTIGLSGSEGRYVNQYSYLPFGESLTHTEGIANPFKYVGQSGVMDEGNGLTFMRNRYYSPDQGRFVESDPIGITGGNNVYTYSNNSTINFIDPTGLSYYSASFGYNHPAFPGSPFGGGMTGTITVAEDGLYGTLSGGVGSSGFSASGNFSNGTISEGFGCGISLNQGFSIANGLDGGPDEHGLGSGGIGYQCGFTKKLPEGFWDKAPVSPVSPRGSWRFDGLNLKKDPFLAPWYWKPFEKLRPVLKFATKQSSSFDPNAITGPAGFGPNGFLTPGGSLPYTIQFENKATASVPAQEVVVTQQLDSDLDWSTFELTDFGFGGLAFHVPAGQDHFSTRLDLRATLGYYVDVDAGLDLTTGKVTWRFTSTDPRTLDLIDDPLAGFLPPNKVSPEGEAFVSYMVRPKAGLATGTRLDAQARIFFDTNAPIDTPSIQNTIDDGPPTSRVVALPAESNTTTFAVAWGGQDDPGGSGIATYDIYASIDGGAFVPWLTQTSLTQSDYTGSNGHTYGFYSIATDNVGHVEAKPPGAQASTRVVSTTDTTVSVMSSEKPSTYGESVSFAATVTAQQSGFGIPTGTVQFRIDGADFGPVVVLVNGAATSLPTATLATGNHVVTAAYSGETLFNPGTSDALTQAVAKAHLTVTADDRSRLYGGANPTLTYVLSGFVNGENASLANISGSPVLTTSAIAASPVGQYAIQVDAATLAADNYTFVAGNGTLKINPAVVTVAAKNLDMDHGDAVPPKTYTFNGFVNGDSSDVVTGTPTLGTSATSTSSAGLYPITIAPGSLAAQNYTFNVVPGVLTVHPKVLDVRVHYGTKSLSLVGLNRDLPFLNVDAIDILFSDDVAVASGDLKLTGLNIASYGFSGFHYNPVTKDATWTLPSPLGIDRLMTGLDGTSPAGVHTPTTAIAMRSDFHLGFASLPGDVNGDGVVNSQDQVLVRNQMVGTGDPGVFIWADVDGNGVVDINDFNQVKKRAGTHLN